MSSAIPISVFSCIATLMNCKNHKHKDLQFLLMYKRMSEWFSCQYFFISRKEQHIIGKLFPVRKLKQRTKTVLGC